MRKGSDMFILYVASQSRSKLFYSGLFDNAPELDVPGMTSFKLWNGLSLGLMPEKGIGMILGDKMPSPESGNGIPRCELYLTVDEPQVWLDKAMQLGAALISHPAGRNWGDTVAYCADPDGHILAFACPSRS